jgi:hypothetical protein
VNENTRTVTELAAHPPPDHCLHFTRLSSSFLEWRKKKHRNTTVSVGYRLGCWVALPVPAIILKKYGRGASDGNFPTTHTTDYRPTRPRLPPAQ